MKPTPQWVKDSLVEDAVAPAKQAGRDVDAVAIESEIVQILERMDRKQADAVAPTKQAKPERDEEEQTRKEFKKRTGRDMDPSMYVDRTPRARKMVQISEVERVGRERMAERMRWIKERPDMFEKIKGLIVGLHSSSPETREKAGQKLREFIESTNVLAGHDWRVPKPQRLMFNG